MKSTLISEKSAFNIIKLNISVLLVLSTDYVLSNIIDANYSLQIYHSDPKA